MPEVTIESTRKTIQVNSVRREMLITSPRRVVEVVHSSRGPRGPAGNGDLTYTMTFTNQAFVIVEHNLGKYPSVTVIDSAGDEVLASPKFTGLNHLTVSFSSSFSGRITCN